MDVNVETQPDAPKPPRQEPPPRRSIGRALISEVRRFYYRVTRENIAGFLWTLAWTIPITVFIWVYAESELTDKDAGQPIRIMVQSSDPTKVVTLLEPHEGEITCDLAGPRSNLDRFKQLMIDPQTPPITIVLDTRTMTDQTTISTLESLVDNPRFRDAGVTISNCSPPIMSVSVDTLAKASVPVRMPALPANVSALNVSFNPPTVMVSGPSKVVARTTEVVADLSSITDLSQPGPKKGNVTLVNDANVKLSPSQVTVSFLIPEQDVLYTLKNIPIWTASPQDDGFLISNENFAPPIDVKGPKEEIDALQNGSVSVKAILEVGPENAGNPTPLPLKIEGLPPDVKLVNPPPEVSFTATHR
jgi:YbbR-like protein